MEYVKEYLDWLPVIGFVIGFIVGWRRNPGADACASSRVRLPRPAPTRAEPDPASPPEGGYYRGAVRSTTSFDVVPRDSASRFPSRDHANAKMN